MTTSQHFGNLMQLGSASGYLDEINEVVKRLSLFEGFTLSEYSKLCEYMECYGALRGETILNEGDEGHFLVIIFTGLVDVMKNDGAGSRKLITRVGPGAFLGEMSVIDGRKRFASCVATQPTDFAVLTRDTLNMIMIEYPRLANKLLLLLLQLTTQRLRETTTRSLPNIVGATI